MKTLKNLFGTKQTEKSIHAFINTLNAASMIHVKGGIEDPDGDLWPPKVDPVSGN